LRISTGTSVASQLRGAPAAFAGDDFVALRTRRVFDSTGENRLHDPLRLDRRRQFGQRRLVHLRTRLVLAGAQALDRQAALFVTVRFVAAGKQRVEAAAESFHLDHGATLSRISLASAV
jgi:hypothetical protein